MRAIRHLLLVAAALCAAASARAVERLELGPPEPAAWTALEGGGAVGLARERTPDGKPALAFTCDMARADSRCYWDRAIALDLVRYGRVSFWLKVTGDPAAISNSTIYFQSGAGWYGAGFGAQDDGWSRVTLDRSAFSPEDAPAGWGAVRTIRLAFWKGQPRRAAVLIGGMEAATSDVAVVLNTRAGREAAPWAEGMAAALARAGIDAGTVADVDVENGVLAGKRIAVYPYNPQPSNRECDALEQFVRAGGKLLVCFSLPPRIGELLGVQPVGFLQQQRPGQFASMHFAAPRLPGLPAEAKQASWNIEQVRPAGHGARVLAWWYDKDGKDTGRPAVVLSDTGAYVSHVLLDDDPTSKDRLLRGTLGHLVPALWREMSEAAVAQAGRISVQQETFAEAERRVAAAARASGRTAAARPDLGRARSAYARATAQLRAARYAEALDAADRARTSLLSAYTLAQRARAGEFRALWCHNAYGIDGLTWDQAMKRLKDAGFTAVVPNMLWGGVADYRSEVLPVRDRVATDGDQIAACVAAGRKYGIQVHVWKVNWNLGGAPEEFVARMRREGRLQRSDAGQEEPWLCPSHPANFELERNAMLEVARKYDVTGIHFDYIRYPDQAHCYCDGCRQRFEALTGQPVANWPRDVLHGGPRYTAYQEFRRSNITRLVKAVSEAAHRLKPGIKVSAAVFSDWPQCREHVGQDWGAWVQAGYLDFVCPMDYSASDSGFRALVRTQRDAIAGRVPLYPGIGASAPGLALGQVIDQVRITRDERANGFTIFNYDAHTLADILPGLARGITAR